MQLIINAHGNPNKKYATTYERSQFPTSESEFADYLWTPICPKMITSGTDKPKGIKVKGSNKDPWMSQDGKEK